MSRKRSSSGKIAKIVNDKAHSSRKSRSRSGSDKRKRSASHDMKCILE